jgi:DNA-directed RNA polymerase
MHRLGVERYRAKTDGHRRLKAETYTAGGRRMFQEAAGALEDAIKAWVRSKVPPRMNRTIELLGALPLKSTAALTARAVLDGIAQGRPRTSVAVTLGTRLEDECRFRKTRDTHKDAWRQAQRRWRGSGYPMRRRAQLLDEAKYWETPWERWTKEERLRLGTVLLELMQQSTGMIRFENRRLKAGPRHTQFVVATDETLKWLEESHEYHEVLYPVWMPTIIPPAPWRGLWGGGYHTDVLIRRPLVKTRDVSYLDELGGYDLTEVLGAINALQGTPWELNPDVHEVFRHYWDLGLPVAGLPNRDDLPYPPKPADIDTNETARKHYNKDLARTRRANEKERSARISTAKLMFLADKYAGFGGRFWMPWKCDWRGRFYPIPSFLQPQGTSLARGLLRFADGAPLRDPEALRWFLIHGANCFGVDKVDFPERVAWVSRHHKEILEVHQDPLSNTWWTSGDKPWEFLAWCLEFGDWTDDPDGFVSKIPVAMDGSNNGLQIFSLLLKDRVGADATNCTHAEAPRDIYQDVADLATMKLREAAQDGHPYAGTWLQFLQDHGQRDGTVPRKCAKRPVMTLPYGATKYSAVTYVRDWFLEELGSDFMLLSPFDCEGFKPCSYLAGVIWKAIHEIVVGARACMEWLQELAELCHANDVIMRWTAPSGWLVKQKYTTFSTRTVYTAIGDVIRKPKMAEDDEKLHRQRARNGVSPNFVHSLDAAVLVKTVNAAALEGVESFAMVHDSYGVLAADAPAMARILREQYSQMFTEDLLEDFRSQIQALLPSGVQVPPVPPMGDLDPREVESALYFFA